MLAYLTEGWGVVEWAQGIFAAVVVGVGLWVLLAWLWDLRPGRSRRNDPRIGWMQAKLKRRFHADDLAELAREGGTLWRPDRRKVRDASRSHPRAPQPPA